MKILVSGSGGLIGSALTPFLCAKGHQVGGLVRSTASLKEEDVLWNPATGDVDEPGLEGAESVVHLAGQNIAESIDAFVKAFYVAVPGARQTTQSGACPWEFAKVFVRKGQRLQVPFETPVKAKNGGFLEPSKEKLCSYLSKKEKLSGSLFGKVDEFTFGEDENFNIDRLIESIQSAIQKV